MTEARKRIEGLEGLQESYLTFTAKDPLHSRPFKSVHARWKKKIPDTVWRTGGNGIFAPASHCSRRAELNRGDVKSVVSLDSRPFVWEKKGLVTFARTSIGSRSRGIENSIPLRRFLVLSYLSHVKKIPLDYIYVYIGLNSYKNHETVDCIHGESCDFLSFYFSVLCSALRHSEMSLRNIGSF